ncbi:outer membrane beta-barrel protein [Pseudoalteromonas sp. McH1-42]|uniref:outer membrane protein n=1 Tax=Pseudoalteromonas sp. McH1-42 TaxID=2917752 RepID=UPI001EF58A6B|nr:outer membrane beta-barrel protein [Pseudoalteromonas sp. McH1-42]MCG7560329.1 outer membrane beta-barrel protein [Pseudoalteromonas sp. McH1-42]
MNKYRLGLLTCAAFFCSNVYADGWFVRPVIGTSFMSDTSGTSLNVDSVTGSVDVDLNTGFNAGLGIGYRYNKNWASEFYWEYRTNDSTVDLAGQSNFNDGNYASNIFYINTHYILTPESNWKTYLGAGLGWVQEVDIDLERGGVEQSYSGDGSVAWQLFLGTEKDIAENLSFQAELRYGRVSGIDLDGEGVPGTLMDLDYTTTTVQVGLRYEF